MLSGLIEGFSGPGAVFMYAITAVMAYALAIGIERGFMFFIRWKIKKDPIQKLVNEGDYNGAAELASDHPMLILIASAGNAKNREEAWDTMSMSAPAIENRVSKRLSLLAAAGNVATMLGLLGTVYGLIYALEGLDTASAVDRTARLSEGIAAAMTTTAWGLIVGIPALAAHAFLSSKAREILNLCEQIGAMIALQKEKK